MAVRAIRGTTRALVHADSPPEAKAPGRDGSQGPDRCPCPAPARARPATIASGGHRVLHREGFDCPAFARSPGKSLTHSLDTNAPLPGTPGLAPLEPNHCSTTRDSNAPSAANHSPRPQHPDQPDKDLNRDVSRRERLQQTAPATHETRPTGPGLTCEFDSGRCWVRTKRRLSRRFYRYPLTCL